LDITEEDPPVSLTLTSYTSTQANCQPTMSYHHSDSMANLNRQDARTNINADQPMPPANVHRLHRPRQDDDDIEILPHPNQRPRTLPNYLTIVETYQSFKTEHPKFLVEIVLKLAKKYASMQSAIQNHSATIASLEEHQNAHTLPTHFKLQQKMVDSIEEIQDKQNAIAIYLKQAHRQVTAKRDELLATFDSCFDEMHAFFDQIAANSRSFSIDNIDIDHIFMCCIEYTMYEFAIKKAKDVEAKERKKIQLSKKKEVDQTPKILTTREFDRLTNQVKALQKQVKNKPKNAKGGPLKKKQAPPVKPKGKPKPKPKTKNQGKKNGKGNGNKRNSTARRR
jgi:hypothetical protein